MKRAKTYEEIKPLIALCKLGKLFDVQAWIAAGKPVNPPLPPEKGPRPRSPLEYAIDAGFHSLVQVLLDGGAEIEQTDRYSSLNHALGDRQYEVAKLLVEHGADVKSVDMYTLFHTWEATIITYFIDRGADVETNNPLAQAFCSRIWAALRVFKQYQGRFRRSNRYAQPRHGTCFERPGSTPRLRFAAFGQSMGTLCTLALERAVRHAAYCSNFHSCVVRFALVPPRRHPPHEFSFHKRVVPPVPFKRQELVRQ